MKWEDYKDAPERISNVMSREGVYLSVDEATKIWKEYSHWFAAGWLLFPDGDGDLIRCVKKVMDDEPGLIN